MLKHRELTDQILKAYYQVYNTLGYGFLEKVYVNALMIELDSRGLQVARQAPLTVFYKGQPVGEYFADLLVNDTVILEIKAVTAIIADHGKQLINYLKASRREVGLVLNFGPRPEFQRRIYDHQTGTDTIDDF